MIKEKEFTPFDLVFNFTVYAFILAVMAMAVKGLQFSPIMHLSLSFALMVITLITILRLLTMIVERFLPNRVKAEWNKTVQLMAEHGEIEALTSERIESIKNKIGDRNERSN